MRFTQLGTPAVASILVFSLTAVVATPVLAQSGSYARLYDFHTGSYPCSQASSGTLTSANCPPMGVTGGFGSANTAQDLLARTLSGHATWEQTDLTSMTASTQGRSYQTNQFNVVGTSGSSDQLVFHILTSGPYATGALGLSQNSYGLGSVHLSGSTGVGYSDFVAYGDGTTTASSNSSTSGPGYIDFVFPFSSYTGGYNYYWYGEGYTYAAAQNTPFLILSGGFSGMLDAIYAVNGQGQTYGSVDFNTAQLDLTSSVPEPASLALLGTGLFGLVPMMRRKLRK